MRYLICCSRNPPLLFPLADTVPLSSNYMPDIHPNRMSRRGIAIECQSRIADSQEKGQPKLPFIH